MVLGERTSVVQGLMQIQQAIGPLYRKFDRSRNEGLAIGLKRHQMEQA